MHSLGTNIQSHPSVANAAVLSYLRLRLVVELIRDHRIDREHEVYILLLCLLNKLLREIQFIFFNNRLADVAANRLEEGV